MTNNMEVKKRISGSVNPKDKYVMNEKLKDKNKNAQWFVLFSIVSVLGKLLLKVTSYILKVTSYILHITCSWTI